MAKTCVEGNRLLRQWIRESGLPLNECGKLLVSQGERDYPMMDSIINNCKSNSVS